jgi:hypothetical protein
VLKFADGVTLEGLTVTAEAKPPVGSATVDFPKMTASDTNHFDNKEEALLAARVCTVAVSGGGEPVEVFPSTPPPGKGATLFPVGSTLVVCTVEDAAGLWSNAVSFSVTVRCPDGYALKGGACKGEGSGGMIGCWNMPTAAPPALPVGGGGVA